MNIVADLTIKALRDIGTTPLPLYERALIDACERHPPPFGMRAYGELYREVAQDPGWLATSLVANAGAEGDGSERLWDLSSSTSRSELAIQVRQHSVDESRHAKWYISILDLVFPESFDSNERRQLDALSPNLTLRSRRKARADSMFAHELSLDDLIQMNIAEIRTRLHHMLQRPMLLAHCDPERHGRLIQLLDRLLLDETRHIGYTAQLIEYFGLTESAGKVRELMHERMCDFNAITESEMNQTRFPSCAQCTGCASGTAVSVGFSSLINNAHDHVP